MACPTSACSRSPSSSQAAQLTAQATTLPLLCDADTGFGEALNVERTVRLFEAAGVAGIHLEDQELPKRCGHLSGKSLVAPEAMAAKIRAAVAARRDPDFVIIARTDARGVNGFDDAVRARKLYLDAGADAIFPEALETRRRVRAASRRPSPAPLLANMTEFGKSPNSDVTDTRRDWATGMVLFPLTAFRVAMKAAEETLRDLLAHGDADGDDLRRCMTRAELYDLLGYTGYEGARQGVFWLGERARGVALG